MTKRLGTVLPSIVSLNQSAFIPGQVIHNHIMMAYELLKGYTRKGGPLKCMLQLGLPKAYNMVDWNALETVLHEVGMPHMFTHWINIVVTNVSYEFNINGHTTDIMQARRGLRQRDPISPLMFVIMMDYLDRLLRKMQTYPGFNFHSKCEKVGLTILTFADDILLFCRGDVTSVQRLLKTVQPFSEPTGLVVNPKKCKVFCGGMDRVDKEQMIGTTGFTKGQLPMRYLGVPITSKRLSINHYMPLIDKIMYRIAHLTSRLLSYSGRILLVKSVILAITQYWMQCVPIPQFVIRIVFVGCLSRMEVLLLAGRALWLRELKIDNLWVKWIQMYYLKGCNVMKANISQNSSWVVKRIMDTIEDLQQHQQLWDRMLSQNRFKMNLMYAAMNENDNLVDWRSIFHKNLARPRANFITWMLYHAKLATKDRLKIFNMIMDSVCSICKTADENIAHLFFDCRDNKEVWCQVLQWIDKAHHPLPWAEELKWVTTEANKKGWKACLLRLAFSEIVYGIWKRRNSIVFTNSININIVNSIIENIVYRSWQDRKLRNHFALLMV
ncbi:uncharacterized protein LOC131597923 [Vicia villosa]|uniref:uncharacterized protein LOC131597923 n=1 Tax=Vicia villosa TaxID=3911 RepID=UPI00273B12F8|nr:uncharacterized protein LOC131597923 [Vicia villosa]